VQLRLDRVLAARPLILRFGLLDLRDPEVDPLLGTQPLKLPRPVAEGDAEAVLENLVQDRLPLFRVEVVKRAWDILERLSFV